MGVDFYRWAYSLVEFNEIWMLFLMFGLVLIPGIVSVMPLVDTLYIEQRKFKTVVYFIVWFGCFATMANMTPDIDVAQYEGFNTMWPPIHDVMIKLFFILMLIPLMFFPFHWVFQHRGENPPRTPQSDFEADLFIGAVAAVALYDKYQINERIEERNNMY